MAVSGAILIQILPIIAALIVFLTPLQMLEHIISLIHLTFIQFLHRLVVVRSMVEDICVVVQVDVLHCSVVLYLFLVHIIIVHFLLFAPTPFNESIPFLYLLLQIVHHSILCCHCFSSLSIFHPLLGFPALLFHQALFDLVPVVLFHLLVLFVYCLFPLWRGRIERDDLGVIIFGVGWREILCGRISPSSGLVHVLLHHYFIVLRVARRCQTEIHRRFTITI